ncbi:hypothetical protein FH974_18745 [Photobacterium ganghwense]|nr:hypothetical protein FH974_18745 [Photobacterium ganghwense]
MGLLMALALKIEGLDSVVKSLKR